MTKNIFITPFNDKSIALYHKLKIDGVSIAGFMDSDEHYWGKAYDGTFIFQRFYSYDSRVYVTEGFYSDQIVSELISKGYSIDQISLISGDIDDNYIYTLIVYSDIKKICSKIKYNTLFRRLNKRKILFKHGITSSTADELYGLMSREKWEDKNTHDNIICMKELVLPITTKCSLRCEKCAAGMQYISEPMDVDFNTVIDDFNRMIELIDWTDRLSIIGGEPFLNRNLDIILQNINLNPLSKKKIGYVQIITNGTIVPSDDICKAIADTGTLVFISNYGRLSRSLDQLCNKLCAYGITYAVSDKSMWSDCEQLNDNCIVQDTKTRLFRRHEDCCERCHEVFRGKFYLCGLLKTMSLIGITPYNKDNYVDIYDIKAKSNIAEYISCNNPLPTACSWCNGCSTDKWKKTELEAAVQINHPLSFVKER